MKIKYFFMILISSFLCSFVSAHDLVDIKKINSHIRTEIMYATDKNFTGKVIYSMSKCCVLKHVAQALDRVQKELEKQGLGLLIWDGYRPHRAQFILWNVVSDKRYVADPKKGSKHNRGCVVDVTLIRLSDGKKLVMPTEFDDFTSKAHRDCMDLPQEAIQNRELLQNVMEKHGFTGLPHEWWHFDYKDWQNHPLLDIPFSKLS